MPSLKAIETKHSIISQAASFPAIFAAAPTNAPPPASPNAPFTTWKTRIYRIVIGSVGGATTLTFQDTGGTGILAPMVFGAASTVPLVIDEQANLEPLCETGVGLGAQLASSANVQVNVDVWWLQGP